MKARGWEPAWLPGTPVIDATLQPGTKVNMIVDAKTAQAISVGDTFTPGGWATFDNVSSLNLDMRQRAAITSHFKPSSGGPSFVVEMEITAPVKSNFGFAGMQKDQNLVTLRGGATQIHFDETIVGKERNAFLRLFSEPKLLK